MFERRRREGVANVSVVPRFFDDFPAPRARRREPRRYRPSVAAPPPASAWGGAGALLRACADAGLDDWVLVLATLLARGDALEAAFSRAGGGRGGGASTRRVEPRSGDVRGEVRRRGRRRERRARRRIQEARRGRGEDQERSDAEARGEGGEVRRGVRGEARAREARGEVRRGRERREARRGEARLEASEAGARRVARVF